jgi:hypothetical protein
MNIALVGGGKAAVSILDHFLLFREHRVIGVADIKSDAPGIVRALELGVETTSDMNGMVKRNDVELIIEITGSEKVQDMLREILRPDQQMVTAKGAKLMTDLIEIQTTRNAAVAEAISRDFSEITNSLENTLNNIEISFHTIERLLREGSIISINASIEAARAGKAGKPFEVVVQRIAEMVNQIKDASDIIGQASVETNGTLANLHAAEKRLQESFTTRSRKNETQ